MGEDFYCIVKLVSGEEILSLVCIDEDESIDDPIIVLQNPVEIKMIHNNFGSYMKIKPWIEISNDDIFIIRMSKIITMTETKDKRLINAYNNYNSVENVNNSSKLSDKNGKVKVTDKMGYVSSVEEARKKLENIFKGIKET